ncbi:SHOCT domain-containing protein [Demequina muriae]|uniref:SHOCT domain-containing protein n=1 Tax=Demequina muriae TaxID=3051664 RepID=A0ABT8GG34_9MICO|nr:SHOCT domain-containing protein [Demequina sp. EGI L300058]MDN4480404.1 SHOCT domain-containing protein [Demequina sp. EGI L300058]
MEFLENFVSIMLYTLWIMVMISFFVIVIRIIMDVFRDRDLSGWGKAGWLILIALVPVLGSVIYLLARGTGMARRDVAAAQAIREAQVDYTKGLIEEAGGAAGQIRAAKELLDAGAITAAEYEALKAKALS